MVKSITKIGLLIVGITVILYSGISGSRVAVAATANSTLHQRGLIQIQSGKTSAQIESFLLLHNIDRYTFQASAGQNATLTIHSPDQDVLLTIVDPEGSPIVRYESGKSQWVGKLPMSGTYTIDAVNVKADTKYTLDLNIQ
jgi:hypothetical protein